jgi:hypothetical protein
MESMLYNTTISEGVLPEAVQTPPNVAIKLNAWAGVAVVVLFLSRWWLQLHADWDGGLRTLVALAPIVPSLLWARSIARWMRQLDEMHRRVHYEAWFFAAVGTVFLVTALNLVESAGVFRLRRLPHGLGWEGAFAAMFFLYGAGLAISNRRYK